MRTPGQRVFGLLGAVLLAVLLIRGTLDKRTCLPQLAITPALTICVSFAWVTGLNEAVPSNIPSRADINERARERAALRYPIAKRVRP